MRSEKLHEWGLLKEKIEIKDLSCQVVRPDRGRANGSRYLWDLHSIPASCNSSIGGSECTSAVF
jgi:hypothetical protein